VPAHRLEEIARRARAAGIHADVFTAPAGNGSVMEHGSPVLSKSR